MQPGRALPPVLDPHRERMEPSRNNRGLAHENGAIESRHGHLKTVATWTRHLFG